MQAGGFHPSPAFAECMPDAISASVVGMNALRGIKGLLVDLDGTLYVGDEPLPGVREALEKLRAARVPMRFLTNTTTKPRAAIVAKLDAMGLEIEAGEIFTAPRAAAEVLRARGILSAYFLLKPPVLVDMEGIELAEEGARAVVIGDMGADFTYERLNRAFRLLIEGAEFYALAENRMFRDADGLCLDVGAFVRGLEYASRREATLLGKPARAFFETALAGLGLPPNEVACIGDDLEGDVGGAQGAGLRGVLVRTGKFRAEELAVSPIRPDAVLDSFADVADLFQ
jgi:HAD superfamily hydrolase (TIGR01458 family)